jgi:hypothetical protein
LLVGPIVVAGMLCSAQASFALGLPLPPINSGLPQISGTAQAGQTVSCSSGSWTFSGSPPDSYAYTWQRDASNISGATSSQYTLTGADVEQAITCTVVASDTGGSSLPATSLPIVPVASPVPTPPVVESLPVISGTAAQGQTVTCSPGAWAGSPTSYAYSWQQTGSNISGQTGNQYTLTSGDVGQAITCTVVASNASGNSLPAVSPPILPVSPPVGAVPVNTAGPVVSGTAQQGQTVGCSPGTWLNSPTGYAYTWQRTGSAIAGATSGQYTLTSADVSQAITCTVVASNGSGNSLPAVSLPIIPSAGNPGSGGGTGSGSGSGTGGKGGGGTGGKGGGGGGGGGGGSGGAKTPAPTLRSFSVTPHTVTVTVRGRSRSTRGTTFSYSLDRPAGLLIEIQHRIAGRLQGGHCVAATARNRKGRSCTRWVTVKVLKVTSARAGKSRLQFAGRIGSHLVAVGTYRAYAAAVNIGGWSKVRSASFVVKSKRVAPPRPRRPSHPRH